MYLIPTALASIICLVAPLGVAGQNAGIGLAILLFAGFCYSDRYFTLRSFLRTSLFKQYAILWLIIVLPITLTTLRNNSLKEGGRFLLGNFLALLLFSIGVSISRLQIRRKFITDLALGVLGLVALVSITQLIFGWKLEGVSILPHMKRAQGFYSHPLTLAYAALTIMPIVLASFLSQPDKWRNQVAAASIFAIVFSSLSITVMTLTVITTCYMCIKVLSRKKLLLMSVLSALAVVAILQTQNPVSEKFFLVLEGRRSDHETPYADDRLAFWHAHWEMFKDSPFVGHGTNLSAESRKPYYDKIGLGHISRMYEAHNMFLQAAVEGGIVAVFGMLSFFYWWNLRARRVYKSDSWQRLAFTTTPVVFALGGLTQNAFQDSEVRYMLMLACALSFSSYTDRAPDHDPS